MRTFTSPEELLAAEGETLGTSDWLLVDQARVDLFAEATGDHQWIHVDPERAKDGPFGQTIAHGYLTLSLLPQFSWAIWGVERTRLTVNYGSDKVRFPAPVPVGSRVRATAVLSSVTEAGGGLQLVTTMTVEREGGDKPVCVAQTLSRVYF